MDIKALNDWLKTHGNIEDKPIFRIVWSNEQKEFRKGFYEDYYDYVLIRRVLETRLVEKYPNNPDRWILERFIPIPENPELPGVKYSYEPLYVFEDAFGKPTYPVLSFLEIIVHKALYGFKKKSLQTMHDEEVEKLNQLKRDYRLQLDNEHPELPSRLVDGTAVSVPAKEFKNGQSDDSIIVTVPD